MSLASAAPARQQTKSLAESVGGFFSGIGKIFSSKKGALPPKRSLKEQDLDAVMELKMQMR